MYVCTYIYIYIGSSGCYRGFNRRILVGMCRYEHRKELASVIVVSRPGKHSGRPKLPSTKAERDPDACASP